MFLFEGGVSTTALEAPSGRVLNYLQDFTVPAAPYPAKEHSTNAKRDTFFRLT